MRSLLLFLVQVRSDDYEALATGLREVTKLRDTVSKGVCIANFGAKADEICSTGPAWVCAVLDGQLRCLYEKQLSMLVDAAVSDFRHGHDDEYLRMVKTERNFVKAAEESTRNGAAWSYDGHRAQLRSLLAAVAAKSAELRQTELKVAQQRAQYFTALNKLVNDLEDATQAHFGLDSPVDAGLALRIPETNINLSAALQRAKTTVQLSVVPDDSASLLGPSGFNKPKISPGDLAFTYKSEFKPSTK